jgi:hypothetical protein
MFAVAAGLVLLGHLLIAEPAVHLGYDATFYTRMVEGPMAGVPAPFRFRVLVPWLARQLPVPAPLALLIISYCSLFGCYVIVMASCRAIGLGLRESIFGVVAVWGSPWHLYHFWNPYLTDAFGLLMLTIMMWAVLTGTLWIFATASLIGVLAREGTAMLVPAWLVTRQWGPTILLALGTLAVAALPRLWLAASPETTIVEPARSGNQLAIDPVRWVRQVHAIWGIVWLLALAGGLRLPRPYARRLGAVLAALLVGSVAASAVATDTGRMFAFLAPALAVACAQLYAVLRRRDAILTAAVTIAVAIQWIFNAPDVVIAPSSWIAGWPRRVFVAAGLLLGLAILVRVVWKTDGRADHTETRVAD